MIDNNITKSSNISGAKATSGTVNLQKGNRKLTRLAKDYFANKKLWDLKGWKIASDEVKEIKKVSKKETVKVLKEVKEVKEDN